MARGWKLQATDRPGDELDLCTHVHTHLHGTASAYAQCDCRCDACGDANSRHLHAAAGGKHRAVANKNRSMPITTITPQMARSAAVVVMAHATDDADAQNLLDMLGLTERLQEREVA